jgi:hypothetical protein
MIMINLVYQIGAIVSTACATAVPGFSIFGDLGYVPALEYSDVFPVCAERR